MPRWYLLALLTLIAVGTGSTTAADADGIAFFEQKIRPVLAEHCYNCHSEKAQANKKLKASLQVDSRAALLKGGDSGPALVPGKAEASLLIKVLRYNDEPRMPPKRRLSDSVIADFVTWVNMGAPAPRGTEASGKRRVINIEEGRKFWAYQLPKLPAPPVVKETTWPAGDIDRFILAGLEAKGLKPVAEADRATLARRLYYDLIGLPPAPEELDAFVNDRAPDAYEKLVDRLLASPQYGERWGRHWLDVARYAESLTLRGFILKEAWRYRDYVIDSFNADTPYDRFMQEQVAGDLLPATTPADRRRQIVATAFLTMGNNNLEEQDKKQLRMDVVDEQLDTISRAFLAQTITCARCHDHKFDPIPTKDYYALAGILRNAKTLEHANVSKWMEVPLPVEPEQEAEFSKAEKTIAELQGRIKELKSQLAAKGKTIRSGVIAIKDLPGIVVDDTQAKKVGDWKMSQYSGTYVGNGYSHDGDSGKGEKTLTFQPELPAAGKYEVRLAYSAGSNRSKDVPVHILSADGEKTVHVNQQETPPIEGLFVSLGQYQFEKNNQGYVLIANEGTKGHVIADAVLFIPVEKLAPAADSTDSAKPQAANETETLRKMEAELKKLQDSGPRRPRAMTVLEEKEIGDTQVHIRGSVHNLGDKAPRGYLQVAAYGNVPAMPAGESGRRQLGEWLAGTANPLPARVMANRVWHWLFGAGLVRTTDNFGTTGELPSHPELLDYLAVRFVEDGWSVKKLVRRVVLSRTYRLSSVNQTEALAADPDNRLVWHMNRRRLDAECIRDTMLFVSGQLKLDRGGPTFPPTLVADYGYRHTDTRRSVYAPVFRNALPQLFEVFDFADPSVTTGRRNVSTVAPQALFLMNHPFVIEEAKHAAHCLLAEKGLDDDGRITRAYRLALGREPSAGERRVALKFLADKSDKAPEAWPMFCQALFASLDFRYVN
jgi:hypothetical protein